jgi:hypothetical protein
MSEIAVWDLQLRWKSQSVKSFITQKIRDTIISVLHKYLRNTTSLTVRALMSCYINKKSMETLKCNYETNSFLQPPNATFDNMPQRHLYFHIHVVSRYNRANYQNREKRYVIIIPRFYHFKRSMTIVVHFIMYSTWHFEDAIFCLPICLICLFVLFWVARAIF